MSKHQSVKRRVRVVLNLSSPEPTAAQLPLVAELVEHPTLANNLFNFVVYCCCRYPGVFREQLRLYACGTSWVLDFLVKLLVVAALLPVVACSALVSTCRRGSIYVRNRSRRGINARPAEHVPTQAS